MLLFVGLNERVQFAIRDLVENPAVGADILHRRGQFDPQLWIALRDDRVVVVDLPLWRGRFGK